MNPRQWYGWLLDRWDVLRASYWFFPVQMALLSGALAIGMVEADRRVDPTYVEAVPWLGQVSAAGARSVLSTIAGSMMTVTSVVFSITIVALTLTSSQFGPRLLRTFLRDRASQVALGTFVATFFYTLLVLRAVESPERVPVMATAGGVALAIVSLFVLIFYVHHAVSSIQASSVIASVVAEIEEHLPRLFPETIGEGPDPEKRAQARRRIEEIEEKGLAVRAEAQGYVRLLDDETLMELAREHDLLVHVLTRPGAFVSPGRVLLRVGPAERADDEVQQCLRATCVLGDHRTPVQDLCFLTDQLAEMAARALSPGVNDPKIATECVHRLGAVIAEVAGREMPSGHRYDDDVLRVVVEPTRFEEIVASALDPVRRHGAHDAQVATAVLEGLAGAVEACTDQERRRILDEHAREVRDAFLAAGRTDSKRDLAAVEAAFGRVQEALAEEDPGGTRPA